MEINGVKIGDRFTEKTGSKIILEVVDFLELRSLTDPDYVSHRCIAKCINGLANNRFEVPFSSVIRRKIN